jgi:ubiquitin C-terminal hydrolase
MTTPQEIQTSPVIPNSKSLETNKTKVHESDQKAKNKEPSGIDQKNKQQCDNEDSNSSSGSDKKPALDTDIKLKKLNEKNPTISYEKVWSRLAKGMERGTSIVKFVDRAKKLLMDANTGKLPGHSQTCIIGVLPECMKNILFNKEIPSVERVAANDFLQMSLLYILTHLDQLHRNTVCQILDRFLAKTPFYSRPPKEEIPDHIKKTYIGETDDDKTKAFARMPKGEHEVSLLFVVNINFFGQNNGFTLLLNTLQEEKLNLYYIKYYLKPIVNVKDFLTQHFLKSFVPQIQKAVFARLLEHSQIDLLPEQKSQYNEILGMIQRLLQMLHSDEEVNEIVSIFYLNVALRYLKTDSLENRLKGLKIIKKVLENAKKEEKKLSSKIANFLSAKDVKDEEKEAKVINPKIVVHWMEENGVIDMLFQLIKSHVEILRQGVDILIFISKHSNLTKAHLDALWEGSLSVHEYDKQIIYACLSQLSTYLSSEKVDHLLERIHNTPIEHFNLQILDLVLNFTKVTVKAGSEKKFYGLELFWKLVQDKSPVSSVIAKKAFEHLIALLSAPEYQSQRQIYIDSCVTNISNSTSVPVSLELIQKILSGLPKKRQRKAIIETIEQRRKLLRIFFQDLVKYKQLAIKRAEDEKSKVKGTIDLNKMHCDYYKRSKWTHLEQIRLRLQFLNFIQSNSHLVLNMEQVDTLWDCLITQALTPEEMETTFQWLEKEISLGRNEGNTSFSEIVLQHLFVDKMLKMDCSQLTEAGFHVFERLFIAVNERSGKIRFNDENLPFVTSNDLIGLSNFWDIVLGHKDVHIATAAAHSLNSMHQNVDRVGSKSKVSKIREEYVRYCMNSLIRSAELMNTSEKDRTRVDRCLALLKMFIEDFDKKIESQTLKMKPKQKQRERVGMQLKVWLQSPGRPRNMVILNTNTTVQMLKQKAADIFKFDSVDGLQVTVGQSERELKDDDKTLAECKITDETCITIKRREREYLQVEEGVPVVSLLLDGMQLSLGAIGVVSEPYKEYLKKMSDDGQNLKVGRTATFIKTISTFKNEIKRDNPNHPSQLLAQDIYFTQFYSLLDVEEQTAYHVWQLLNLIPQSTALIQELRNTKADEDTKETPWNTFIDAKRLFKLVYNLQILETLVTSQQSDSQNQSFAQLFIATNGVQRLIDLFFSLDEKMQSIAAKKAYSQLLRVLNLFVLEKHSNTRNYSLVNSLLNDVDLKKLVTKLMNIINASANVGPRTPPDDDPEIVRHAMKLLIPCVVSSSNILSVFSEFPNIKGWITALVLGSPHHVTREEGARGLISLISQITNSGLWPSTEESPATHFFNLLISELKNVNNFSKTCDQYFYLLENLMKSYQSTALPDLLTQLIHKVEKHPIVETSSSGDEDKVLIGTFNLLVAIVKKDVSFKRQCAEANLIHELFNNCLFAIPTAENYGPYGPPKCKTKASRQACFCLLTELARDCSDNFKEIVQLLSKQIEKLYLGNDYSFSPSRREKSKYGYVGLQNQGATCYMNSLMQQLYLIPNFRREILSAVNKSKENQNESLLYQMQRMFGYLQESEKGAFDTSQFCASYKDAEGKPVNTSQQMDANEFFNMLFDRLENLLKGTPQEKVLKEVFGGTLCNQIIPRECPHKNEREEPFYTISVEIKNKKDILESLKLFVEGELLTGDNKYYCETCKQHVETLKRCCISQLPPVLIIHLKRFEFDYDRMRHEKLNSFCSFPMTLNMQPYTKEGLELSDTVEDSRASFSTQSSLPHSTSYYEYELVGVVVHQGSVDCGHYYSFIKERIPLQGTEPRWFEFNDTTISPFDPNKIAEECFGGEEEIKLPPSDGKGPPEKRIRVRTNNAYILVYQRKTQDVESLASHSEASERVGSAKHTQKPYSNDKQATTSESMQENNNTKDKAKEPTDSKSDDNDNEEHSSRNNWTERVDLSSSTIEQMISRCAFALLFIGKLIVALKRRRAKMSTLSARVKVPDDILKDIWDENRQFILEKYIFDPTYFSFIWNLINIYSPKLSGTKNTASSEQNEKEEKKDPRKIKSEHDKVKLVKKEESDKERDKGKKKDKKDKKKEKKENQKDENNNKATTISASVSKDKDKPKGGGSPKEPKIVAVANSNNNKNDSGNTKTLNNKIKETDNERATVQNTERERIDGKIHNKKASSLGSSSESSDSTESSKTEEELEQYCRKIKVFEKSEFDAELYTIQFATKFLVEVYCRARDKEMFPLWVSRLKEFYAHSHDACRWLLSMLMKENAQFKKMVMRCPADKVRTANAELVANAISTLAPIERQHYNQTLKMVADEIPLSPPPSYVIWFIEYLLKLVKVVDDPNLNHLFMIISEFAKIGAKERKYLLKRKVISLCVNTYFEKKTESASNSLSSRKREPTTNTSQLNSALSSLYRGVAHLESMVDLLATLICSTKPSGTKNSHALPPTLINPPLNISDDERDRVINKDLIFNLLRENMNRKAVFRIAKHYCWEDKQHTKMFFSIIEEGLLRLHYLQYLPFLKLFSNLVRIEDSLQTFRIEYGIEKIILKNIEEHMRNMPSSIETCAKYLVKIANKDDKFKKKLYDYKANINSLLDDFGFRIT